MRHRSTRRDFLSTGVSLAGAAAAITIVPRHVLGGPRNIPPSEKMNIAGIGFGGMGAENLDNLGSENIVALCDVDHDYAARTPSGNIPRRRPTKTIAACWTSRRISTAW